MSDQVNLPAQEREHEEAAQQQHGLIGISDKGEVHQHSTHPDAQWFETAGLGLFIHWNMSSVHGGIDISWSMIVNTSWDQEYEGRNKVSPTEYWGLADSFNPQETDMVKWLSAAKKAGFTYAIFTTKHHDGYTMWPSKYSTLGTHTHMKSRDFVKEYVEACRTVGLKVGLYFSVPDWHIDRDYMSFDAKSPSNRVKSEDHKHYYYYACKNQTLELLTQYGKIDMIWFDGSYEKEFLSMEELRKLQPGILVNNRAHRDGDFDTCECNFPDRRFLDWWECLQIWNNNSWGYQKPEGYKPTSWALSWVSKTRAWGGIPVLNCAPRPDGQLPDSYYERMRELEGWMKVNGEAIYQTKGGPWPEQCSLPVTVSNNKWYVFFIDGEQSVQIEQERLPKKVYMLDGGQEIIFTSEGNRIRIELPKPIKHNLTPVVVIEW
ncbi:alpha-L-fucosidase [Paenibacillus roseipurpureus]|uniref:alpha-L-fucosidase n=1 Tax=Paenibacillus roseopurpureus TaxID=2918901 RepID=A0AA96LM13_9BACL|nr:alpha-L-fucosidase [Paenibacillus sp. MBLB1832]WNR43493.1 alpha-L-fucosidase [Paenibacillus sp. MBLB1832]